MSHKAGFVNIIGLPNAGKSTLMNALVGEKLSIITPKAQTTRHRIMGIVNGEDFQIIYSDTPGILKPHYKLHESMMKFVEDAFTDADIFIFIEDITDAVRDEETIARLQSTQVPVIVLVNKIDLSEQVIVEKRLAKWKKDLPGAEIIPVSALHVFNLEKLLATILDLLPESPPFYPKDELTDKTMRFFVSEIIREKVFNNYHKEIPYSAEVIVDEYKERDDIIRIKTYIYVTRETQKAIILGHQGNAIKRVGTEARKDIEDFVGKKVYLELSVKVSKDWRNDIKQLKRFGYDS
jgi:GTP-binding protein Era